MCQQLAEDGAEKQKMRRRQGRKRRQEGRTSAVVDGIKSCKVHLRRLSDRAHSECLTGAVSERMWRI